MPTNAVRSACPSGELAIASRKHELGTTPLSRTSAWNAHSLAFSKSGPIEALLQNSGLPRAPCQDGSNRANGDGQPSSPGRTLQWATNVARSALPCGELAMASRKQELGTTPLS